MTSADRNQTTAPAAPSQGEALSPEARVTITGRNVEVPEHFQERVNSKLAKIEKLDPTLTSFHVELQHEPNPRRESEAERIQITATGSGHLARAESKQENFYAALEAAVDKLERSLRKVKARRNIALSGHRAPKGAGVLAAEMEADAKAAQQRAADQVGKYDVDPYEGQVDDVAPGQIVRSKVHPNTPRSVDDALSEMELVGHDFYLFINEETNRPAVVYRRHAYDYGLIELAPEGETN